MDKGAARSRKRAAAKVQPQSQGATSGNGPQAGPSTSKSFSSDKDNDNKNETTESGEKKHRFKKERPPRAGEQSKDPSLYQPKAIRTAVALIYSQDPFPIPPPAESLTTIRRVDLTGSGATDVSWLEGTGVTWLSLAGCQIEKGWEAVGSLQELSVLNISGCGLKALPRSLSRLSKLKAIVAMNNDWTQLDPEVVSSWTDLNSLIVSHSPSLSSLPATLSNLHHLSKLTFSHCPRLTSSSLPDLSALPLLRDVKMNNLPQLTALPSHLPTWGTGNLSLVGKGGDEDEKKRLGDGLEVLDLGNCSLPYTSISSVFGLTTGLSKKKKILWPHLRSLSLHSNPLAITHPNYAELLQASADLPNLQIIDAKRVVERKRKGQVSESKYDKKVRERKEGKMRPSGANVGVVGKMRKWGGESGDATATAATEKGEVDADTKDEVGSGDDGNGAVIAKKEKKLKEKKREKKDDSAPIKKKRKHREGSAEIPTKKNEESNDNPTSNKRKKQDNIPSQSVPASTSAAVDPTDLLRRGGAQETLSHTQKDRSGRNQTAVVGVIEVKKSGEEVELTSKKKKQIKAKLKKGTDVSGGVNLKELFGKKEEVVSEETGGGEEEGSGLGLGVGGW
ncbi:hypothetical protein CI109_105081 [Kwoniella shandongensis]|uniref:Uncharacterized protein n=1 Tax=Kwoniella shandongensis TaxID=1734106 RepID=A0A5M6C1Y8_9TREE|nr:uncharacterized protein CI109_004319 [Kwoniella shandongensis]KAA5527259.1 hypothetical protein CI109_004319 [Kwoniella shandongensis]